MIRRLLAATGIAAALMLNSACGEEGATDRLQDAAANEVEDAVNDALPSADEAMQNICKDYAEQASGAVTDDAKAALADLEQRLAAAATVAGMTAEAENLTLLSEAHADPGSHTAAEVTAAEEALNNRCEAVNTPLP